MLSSVNFKDIIKISDKQFELFILENTILKRIKELSDIIKLEVCKDTIFVCVLKGGFTFFYNLINQLNIIDLKFDFVSVSSYNGKLENGTNVIKSIDLSTLDYEKKNVIIIEDIIDTGNTINFLKNYYTSKKINSLKIATLIFKPKYNLNIVKPDFIGFEIENEFIIGFGMDYLEEGRSLKEIYKLKS